MKIHKICNIFPSMNKADFLVLKNDIEKHGQQVPIATFNGEIIDGKHRFLACRELGIKPRIEPYIGTNPISYAVSLNQKRRHLSPSQRAVIGVELIELFSQEAAKRMKAGIKQQVTLAPIGARDFYRAPKSAKQAAKVIGASERSVEKAKAISQKAPELAEQVKAGNLTINAAEKQIRLAEMKKKRQALPQINPNTEKWNLIHGDMSKVKISTKFDFIITDPPYPKEFLPLYDKLAVFSREHLKDGGSLICMVGQSYLPEIITKLSQELIYRWCCAYLTPGAACQVHHTKMNSSWKPLLWLTKGKSKYIFVQDVMRSPSKEKDDHEWQQSIGGMEEIIKNYTMPGDHVCDPFMGTGTTGLACFKNCRLFTGVEINDSTYQAAKERFSENVCKGEKKGEKDGKVEED